MSHEPPRPWVAVAVGVLLALHFTLAVSSKLHESTTSDELVHLTGGYSYWKFDDYRLQPENGNLPQRWEALPAWLSGAPFPTLDQDYWRTSDAWVMGHEFFYETGKDHFPMLMAARSMAALLSVATGLLIFLWSRRLFGAAGGLVSLAFYSFSPSFLAHGALATSDVCITLLMLASAGAWWRHLQSPGPGTFAVSALVLGLACVAKFSAVLLLPILGLCALVYLFQRPSRAAGVAASAAGHAAVAVAVIWAFYGLRYSAFNPALVPATQFIEDWPIVYAQTGRIGQVIHALARARLLPEAFLYGAAYVVQTSQVRGAYLNGEYSITGWVSFFPWTFALKTTLPFLAAGAWGTWCAVRSRIAPAGGPRWAGLLPLTPLLALFGVYWAFSLTSHLNIGLRHLLPTYPVLFILSGALGAWIARPLRWPGLLVAALLVWHAAESAWIFPNYIAYFNELGGGPSRASSHLVDSSLDWGQDLPGLRDWLEANQRPGEPAYLAYFGTGEPRYYHLRTTRIAYLSPFKEDEPYVPLKAGLYCISATMLSHVYSSVQGPWTAEREKEYQALRALEPLFAAYQSDPAARAQIERNVGAAEWISKRDRFLHLRFARLCYCLRARRPTASIGYSIFVYRLGADDVDAATGGSMRAWIALIERSAEGTSGP